MYPTSAADPDGKPYSGEHKYVMHFPTGQTPPVKGFWSLTMYELMPDGRLFFIRNDLNRFALGDRSPGIEKQVDGSFSMLMQTEAPGSTAERAAWLPTPPGEFRVVLRAYEPSEALQQGRASLPRIERLP